MASITNKKHIGILIPRLGIDSRGVETFCYEIGLRFLKNYSVTFWVRKANKHLSVISELRKKGATVIEVPAISEKNIFLQLFAKIPFMHNILRIFHLDPVEIEMLTFSAFSLPSIITSSCDVLFPNNGVWGVLVCQFVRLFKGIPFIYASHGGIEPIVARQKPNAYIAVNQEIKKWLAHYNASLNIHFIPNGVDLIRFNPTGKKIKLNLQKPIFLSVGALIPVKKIEHVVRAVSKLQKGSLLIVGKGFLHKKIEKLGNELLGKKRFKLISADNAEMPTYYRSSDVFVMATQNSPADLVYEEALASNLPVVGNNEPYLKFLIGKAGILVNTNNLSDLTKALKNITNRNFGKLPRLQSQKFSWKITSQKYSQIINKVISSSQKNKNYIIPAYFYCILAIFILGLLLRLWGINFGISDQHILDEGEVIFSAFYAGLHHLEPQRYIYSPFLPHIILFEISIYFLVGKLLGFFSVPSDVYVSYLSSSGNILLLGRITLALIGSFTILILYKIGKEFFSLRVGLVSSFLLAINFLHAKDSHYIKQDVISGFFILLSFYFANKVLRNNSIKNYIWTGFAFGLSIAAKYPAILFSLPLFIAALFAKSLNLKKIILFCISVVIAFCIATPYIFFHPIYFFYRTYLEYTNGAFPILIYHLAGKPLWWHFLFEHIPGSFGIIGMTVMYLGFAICFVKGFREKKYLLIPILPILFVATIDQWSKFHFPRYLIMSVPFFVLAAAICIDEVVKRLNGKIKVIVLILLIILVSYEPFLNIVRFDYILTKSDTRTIAKKWIEEYVPANSKVLLETTLKPELQPNYNAHLLLNNTAIDKRIQDANAMQQNTIGFELLKKANAGKVAYDIVATPRVDTVVDVITTKNTKIKSISYYVDQNVEYLILSSWAIKPDESEEFRKTIQEYYQPIAEFAANPQFAADPHQVKMDYEALSKVKLFEKNQVFGPKITVYKRK